MKAGTITAWLQWTLACLLVRSAALAIPSSYRTEWVTEWVGELWQVRQAAAEGKGEGRYLCLQFSCGALVDARWMRRELQDSRDEAMPAVRCLLLLLTLAVLSAGVTFHSEAVRAAFRQASWHTPPDLALLFLPGARDESVPSVSFSDFRVWAQHAQAFDAFDFYQTVPAKISVGGRSATLALARGTAGLRTTFDGRPGLRTCPDSTLPRLFVTINVWREVLAADSSGICSQAVVDGRTVLVSGVMPLHDSGLPGNYQAWLFEGGEPFFRDDVPGFVVSRIPADMATNWFFGYGHAAIAETPKSEASLLLLPVADRKLSPYSLLVLGFGLSLLALPATTPLGFGEHVRSRGRSPLRFAVRRWLFMLTKLLLWMLLSASTALFLSSRFVDADWRFAAEIQIFTTFMLSLLGLRWAIRDQRRRCPVCLKALTQPARVGEVSRNFLSWSGTELMCGSGHGLLHVPSHATSWFRTQRWLTLDASWQFLFAQKR